MITEENKTEIIDGYLNGTLDVDMLAEVEYKMREDADFKMEVELQKALVGQLQWEGREKLRGHLKTLHKQNFPEDSTESIGEDRNHSSRKLWLGMAASVALLFVAGLIFFLANQKPTQRPAENGMHVKVPLYTTEGNGLGFAGKPDATATDSINVIVISGTEYQHHYQFDDTLKLYLNQFSMADELSVTYDKANNTYQLLWNNVSYEVDRGFGRLDMLKKSVD